MYKKINKYHNTKVTYNGIKFDSKKERDKYIELKQLEKAGIIKEVSQQEFWDYQVDEQDGYYYGQSHFQTQEVWIDKDLPVEKKRKTLYHELTHVYIREYLTSRDIKPDEEVLCDISANSHDIIHKIVQDYFKGVN